MVSKIPFGSAQIGLRDPGECWSGIGSVNGCLQAVNQAVFFGNPTHLSPPCCNVINAMGRDCWPVMFPEFGGVSFLLRGVCAFFIILPPLPPLFPVLPPLPPLIPADLNK
ncbi:hypothetical protein M5689_011553 [Euphorbia peplus]|nr:hypothetical protein M5689_011553 [Euphorbia peplus]